MSGQETVLTKKRRGPKPTGKGVLIGVRLQPIELDGLDAYASDQADTPGRPEAIRRLLKDGLERLGYFGDQANGKWEGH